MSRKEQDKNLRRPGQPLILRFRGYFGREPTPGGNKILGPPFPPRGRPPPFNTAPVADSQRSLTRCSKRAHARITKGGGLIAVNRCCALRMASVHAGLACSSTSSRSPPRPSRQSRRS